MKNYFYKNNVLLILFCGIVMISLLNCKNQNHNKYIVMPLNHKPVIDAVLDSVWLNIPAEQVKGDVIGDLNCSGDRDLSATFRSGYYNDTLFFFIDVKDEICNYYGDTLISKFQNDMIQLFFAEGGNKLSAKEMTKKDSIFQFIFFYGKDKEKSTRMYRYAHSKTPVGYCFEIEIPIRMSMYNKRLKEIGFNVEIRDNDNILDPTDGVISGVETYINWANKGAMLFWQKTEYYGDLVLKDFNYPSCK